MARTIKPSDGLTVQAISERLAAKFDETPVKLARLLQKWIPAGIVKPKGSVLRGPGNYREFEPEELDKAALLFELYRHGYPLHRLHKIRQLIDGTLEYPHYRNLLKEARARNRWAMRIGLLKDGRPSLGWDDSVNPEKVYAWENAKVLAMVKNDPAWRSKLIIRLDLILPDL